MTGPTIVPTEWTARLASLVHTIRPDWDEAGTTATLRKVCDRPLADVALAAIVCALTRTDQRSPAVIALDGKHWHALDAQPAQRTADIAPTLCEHGNRPARCEPCNAHRGGPPPPDLWRQMRADIAHAQDRPDTPAPPKENQ